MIYRTYLKGKWGSLKSISLQKLDAADDTVRDRVAEVGGEVEEHDAQNRYAEQFASVTADPAKVEFMVVFQNIPL